MGLSGQEPGFIMNRVNPNLGAVSRFSRNSLGPGYPQRRPEDHGWPPSFPALSHLQEYAGLELHPLCQTG